MKRQRQCNSCCELNEFWSSPGPLFICYDQLLLRHVEVSLLFVKLAYGENVNKLCSQSTVEPSNGNPSNDPHLKISDVQFMYIVYSMT